MKLYWVVDQDAGRLLGVFPDEQKARLVTANTVARCEILEIEAELVAEGEKS